MLSIHQSVTYHFSKASDHDDNKKDASKDDHEQKNRKLVGCFILLFSTASRKWHSNTEYYKEKPLEEE